MRVVVLAVLAGCGRIGFDARSDAAALADAPYGAALVHLDCDGFTGTTMIDRTNRGHDAHCVGECPQLAPGIHGNACLFDGVAELDVEPLAMDSGVGVATWVRIDTDPPATECAISRGLGAGAANSWQFCIKPGGFIYFGTENDDVNAASLSLGTWHAVVIDFDGTTKRVFLDGALSDAEGASPTSYDASPIRLGRDYDNGAPVAGFSGLLDDVYVFDRPLASDEIAAFATP